MFANYLARFIVVATLLAPALVRADESECSCAAVEKCGKTASACSVKCSPPKQATCKCANTSAPCSPSGPYGTLENSCKCEK